MELKMPKIIKEKQKIITTLLKKYKNRLNSKSCNKIDFNQFSLYIEKKLDDNQNNKFENHLLQCPHCLNIYKDIENEINLLFTNKLKEISKPLLEKAFLFIENKNSKPLKSNKISSIIINLKEKGMDLIKFLNCNNINTLSIEPIRENNKLNLLKELNFKSNYLNNDFTVKILYYNSQQINIVIGFPSELLNILQNKNIEILSLKTEILKKINQTIIFENLYKDIYSIKINNDIIFKMEVN